MASTSQCVTCEKCCFGKMCKDYLFDNCVALFTQSLQRKKELKKGEYLYRSGDTMTHLMALRAGSVKIYDPHGNIVNVKTPGQVIGTEDLYTPAYHYHAVAATDIQLCLLECNRLYDLSQITENFINYVTEMLSFEIAEQQKMISVLVSQDAQTKVREYLKLISQRYAWYGFSANHISLPITFKEMATLLGVSISSLNRAFSELKLSEEITVDKKNIQIKNLNA
ncbi:Crp/Fnr family transcriptional regulator [Pseudocitrobacter faecalis]|uniref:Crp/Fnr family transcriptional regulator n=1 Tax=Pseudocitrobacter faecalis TaxID=1398493 RepID=UPI00167AAB2D|nr:Crp/Fnr family transcriptional regulator [Pseudocitrobacter faecalis]GHD94012.1 transcriptional regulator [Pseudocitrobacter faecalis]